MEYLVRYPCSKDVHGRFNSYFSQFSMHLYLHYIIRYLKKLVSLAYLIVILKTGLLKVWEGF